MQKTMATIAAEKRMGMREDMVPLLLEGTPHGDAVANTLARLAV